MKSHSLSATGKPVQAARKIAVPALSAAILLGVQVVLVPLPNIELVSLLIILYTLVFKHRVLYIIYVFALAEGLIFGFHLWWISYLYVWTILAAAVWLCRRMKSPLGWAVLSGAFGLFFGALCAIPYFFIGGPAMALSNWISGIPFDLVHCISNFVICLLLWTPLYRLLAEHVRDV